MKKAGIELFAGWRHAGISRRRSGLTPSAQILVAPPQALAASKSPAAICASTSGNNWSWRSPAPLLRRHQRTERVGREIAERSPRRPVARPASGHSSDRQSALAMPERNACIFASQASGRSLTPLSRPDRP